jgi:GNAT superfamily N-acetyltransferase
MTPILNDFSRPALVRTIQENMLNLCWNVRSYWKQAVFEETPKVRRWWSPIPFTYVFNAAVSTQPPAPDESGLIGETVAFFQSRQRKAFIWWLYPGLERSDWGRQLEACGLRFSADLPGMAMDLAALPEKVAAPLGLQFRRVEDAETMAIYIKTFIPGYGLPPEFGAPLYDLMLATLHGAMTSYLATIDDQPVATASVGLDAGVAGIYNIATLPAWRGKGIGAAITLYALLQARSRGYRAGVLQSSEMGYKVYQRLGFKEYCRIPQYTWT